MTMSRSAKLLGVIVAGLAIGAAMPAQSLTVISPTINNGGFESGSFPPWASGGNNGFDGVTCPGPSSIVHGGNCAAFFGAVGAPSSLSQTVTGNVGGNFTLDFWLEAFGDKSEFIFGQLRW
jgi:hypothetical protein